MKRYIRITEGLHLWNRRRNGYRHPALRKLSSACFWPPPCRPQRLAAPPERQPRRRSRIHPILPAAPPARTCRQRLRQHRLMAARRTTAQTRTTTVNATTEAARSTAPPRRFIIITA